MKRWLYIGGVLLVLIAIGMYLLFSSLNSIVKAAVEKIGSDVTQVQVQLKEVNIELSSGKGALRGLTVGNPPGFKTERALSLGEISLQIDPGSVIQETVVIKEIVIGAPEITYELGDQGSNFDALKRNIDAYTGKGKDKGKVPKSADDGSGGGKKLVVEHLYVRNGKVNINATVLQGKSLSAALPDIHLTNIGKQKGGATAGELAQQVLAAIGQGATKVVTSPDISKLVGSTRAGAADVKGIGEGLKKLFGK